MTIALGKFTALTLPSGVAGCLYLASKTAPLLVLAHGAGAAHDHAHMTNIAEALAEVGISTLRFNLPFMQAGKRRVDDVATSTEAIQKALDFARQQAPKAPIYIGGHSFGGRMATHLAAQASRRAKGLVLFSFPLHVSKKPAISRAAHLKQIEQPLLFLSGTRDALATPELLQNVIKDLPDATVHWLDTADHGFKILKRSRKSAEDVYAEAARITASWMEPLN